MSTPVCAFKSRTFLQKKHALSNDNGSLNKGMCFEIYHIVETHVVEFHHVTFKGYSSHCTFVTGNNVMSKYIRPIGSEQVHWAYRLIMYLGLCY